ncbi:MAG: amino acid adenylation domain-containing protein [Bacteroidota bacterium]|nr:amino acid adenylation domain-containing protein [Bacteroidota bacterium]
MSFDEEVKATICELANEFQKNPLQLCWQDFGKQQPLQLQLDYSTEYFNQAEIELLAQRFLFILEQFPHSFDKAVGSFDIVPPAEKQLIKTFNNSKKNEEFSVEESVIDLFEKQVLRSPDAIALDFENKKISYNELNIKANQFAEYLRSQRIKQETLVPICLTRSIEMIVSILGIMKAGAAYVPIDPEYPLERIQYILNGAAAGTLIINAKTKEKLAGIHNIQKIEIDNEAIFNSTAKSNDTEKKIASSTLAYIIYTSGSTGKPKGVMIEHGSVFNLIKGQTKTFGISSDDKILQFSNYCFDASVEQIFLALCNGASLVLFPEGFQLQMESFVNFLKEKEVSHIHATPSFLENLPSFDSPFLKRVIAGGDICKRELSQRWKTRYQFYNEYGPTETTVTAIEFIDKEVNADDTILLPIGTPLENVSTYIVSPDKDISPIGVLGEIFIGGVQVARGYLNRPELSNDRFLHYPFKNEIQGAANDEPEERVYCTGDLGRWLPNGNIEYLGRIDDQVKIRGYRIELGEIESVLQQHEMVRQVVVIPREHKGDKRLVAYIVPEVSFDKMLLSAWLKTKLPEYMIPALLIEVAEIPLTSNGKVDKKALPDIDADGLNKNHYEEAQSYIEKKLVEIWKKVLVIEKLGINDNFFELGGHSLNAMQLSSRLHKQLNVKIDIGKIFANPTIKELAQIISLEGNQIFREIEKLPAQDSYELSHAQKRFWILSHYADGAKAYNFTGTYFIEGNLDITAFCNAFERVIQRHEILRTVFIEINGEPRQKILTAGELGFNIQMVNITDASDTDKIIRQHIEKDSGQAYDLTRGPLFRATLYKVSDQKNILVFGIHHIISDGWSKNILINEILAFYKEYSLNTIADLPSLPVQYKDYAYWHSHSIERQKDFWKDLFENDIPVLDFPADFKRPATVTFLGEMLHVSLNAEVTTALRKLAVRHKMSLNNLLFSLYGLLVSQYSGQEELVIGSLSSGRSHIDVENLIGVFVNFLPVLLKPSKNQMLSKYLEDCNDSLVHAYNNQDYPFDLMVENFIKKRDFSRNPFFDTMVNFHSENELQTNQNSLESGNNISGINFKPYKADQEDMFQSVLDFKLDIEPSDNILNLYLSYNSKLFSKQRMEKFLENFTGLIEKVINDNDKILLEYDQLDNEKQGIKLSDYQNAEDDHNKLNITICSSFVAEPLEEYMNYWNNELSLHLDIQFSPYNQIFQQLLNPLSLLNKNKGINILFIRMEDWLRDKSNLSAPAQIEFLNATYSELLSAIKNADKTTLTPYLVGIVPVYRQNHHAQVRESLQRLNSDLSRETKQLSRMHLLDLNKIAVLYEVVDMFDDKTDEIGHIPFTAEYYAALGTFLIRKINAYKRPASKVIALDCDNTLWKGVCGEVGASHVIIDENYTRLQEFILEKYAEGFLLVLCSKNNEEDVWDVFNNHPGMKLKKEHITAHRINWDLKANNLLSISKELNLGIDSFIFVDDSEFEVEQISLHYPSLTAIALTGDPADFPGILNHTWAFDSFSATEEDRNRNKMYQIEKQRSVEQANHSSLSDFLESLVITVNILPLNDGHVDRAVQLCMRTNQFNLNGIRKTREEIIYRIKQNNGFNKIIEVSDRFGEYGLVGLVLSSEIQQELVVETFLLSCRVLGRNVEDFILSDMLNYCSANGMNFIHLLFQETEKNKPFRDFLLRTEWPVDPQTNKYCRSTKIASQINVN